MNEAKEPTLFDECVYLIGEQSNSWYKVQGTVEAALAAGRALICTAIDHVRETERRVPKEQLSIDAAYSSLASVRRKVNKDELALAELIRHYSRDTK